ncbi:MAG TPA: hypothetical protein VK416_04110 [Thermoanaerobaculia bacterium]|nr:hypothetical protein [Thermoanaerobaculia bacterium]
MPRLGKARMLVFLGAVGILAAAPSAGATVGFSWPSGRDAVAAGTSVSLAWSLPPGHDEDFREMELVLSLDGGRTFPIRVTRNLDPATRALAWRVPALPSSRARLALRVGDSGEPEDEEILLVSEEFAVEIGAVSRLEPTAFVRGELRTQEALEDSQSASLADPDILEDTDLALGAAGRTASPAAPRRPRTVAAEEFVLRIAAFEAAVRSERPLQRTGLPHIPADTPRRE